MTVAQWEASFLFLHGDFIGRDPDRTQPSCSCPEEPRGQEAIHSSLYWGLWTRQSDRKWGHNSALLPWSLYSSLVGRKMLNSDMGKCGWDTCCEEAAMRARDREGWISDRLQQVGCCLQQPTLLGALHTALSNPWKLMSPLINNPFKWMSHTNMPGASKLPKLAESVTWKSPILSDSKNEAHFIAFSLFDLLCIKNPGNVCVKHLKCYKNPTSQAW